MSDNVRIAVAYGDGIGPEIMEATIRILKESKARLNFETIEIGKLMYERGYSSGIPESAWKTIHDNKILFKAPITTPQGGGYKSLNVTLRKALGLYSNVRPCVAFHPLIDTNHPNLDVVIVRENEEDLYAGIEYRQTHNAYHSIKLITRTGCEKIVRYAFEYAKKNNRKKVTCFSKDNIMKFTDGLFHNVFNEIAKEYPEIQNDHYIIDIGTAKLANQPDIFDVIVTENLYGDIISDVVAEISGSVGLAGSANIGNEYSMFEAIHGSAPDIAGKNIANPSGLINAAIMMLTHLGQGDIASLIHNAWYRTIEDGIHTADIFNPNISKEKVGTKEFADAVIERIGLNPLKRNKFDYPITKAEDKKIEYKVNNSQTKILVGVDVSIQWLGSDIVSLANQLNEIADGTNLGLKMISCRGLKIWPLDGNAVNYDMDLWNLRFVPNNAEKISTHADIVNLLNKLKDNNIDFVKTENLYVYDSSLGFSLAQGE